MVTLPSIESYSQDQQKQLGDYSPVFFHYLSLLNKNSTLFSDQIRIQKHRHWLECALATYCSDISPEVVCGYWSIKTDEILMKTWRHCQISEDKVSLLALGKLGSEELNLSSDIDIVFAKANNFQDEQLNLKIRNFIKLLNESTLFSFAYRVDLNLRPGGEDSPLVPTKQHFYNFYDEYLEAWHRLSFIRARALNSQSKLSQDLISYCKKRCYPKRLDFSVINEIKSVRSKINLIWRKANEPFDIKLHPGGIRDIELYIHSLQVIYGGRNKSAQLSGISQAIKNLTLLGAIPNNESDFLLNFYWRLRKLENLLHIRNDQQTYLVSKNDFSRLSSFHYCPTQLGENLKHSNQIISSFFNDSSDETSQSKSLKNLTGISSSTQNAIDEIQNLKSRSIKKMGVESLKNEILALYIEKTKSINIDDNQAIQIFRDFIFAIKSKTTIFHLLYRHPKLLEHLAWLFSVSPFAGQLLCRRPELIDSFVLGQVIVDEHDDLESFWESLVDYKRLGQLQAIVDLFKNKDLFSYLEKLSSQADFIVTQLQNKLCSELNCDPLEILCMGKWSGKELGIRSDLDFVLLSEKITKPMQRKMARRLINLLTTPSPAGKLYDIDMRLKPNESAGPLIIEKDRLFEFIENKAEPWQRLAYLRSRIINHENFYFSDHFSSIQIEKKDIPTLHSILDRLQSKATDELVDIKYSQGGLLSSELITQMHCLLGTKAPTNSNFRSIVDSLEINLNLKNHINENYEQLRKLEQIFQICRDSSRTKVSVNSDSIERVSKMTGNSSVFSYIQDLLIDQNQQLKSLDLKP